MQAGAPTAGFRGSDRARIPTILALWAAVTSPLACGGEDEPRGLDEMEAREPAAEITEAAFLAARGGVLYARREGGELIPIAALPGADPAPDTLEGCAAAIPRLGEEGFRRLVAGPDSSRVAWQTVGPGACVGVVASEGERVAVLGRWSAAVPDSLIWAPDGRYLAVLLAHPDGHRSLAVFDAAAGAALAMPWQAECEEREDCDVSLVRWVGGTLLNVEIRQGPAELSVPYEVNVGMATAVAPSEER